MYPLLGKAELGAGKALGRKMQVGQVGAGQGVQGEGSVEGALTMPTTVVLRTRVSVYSVGLGLLFMVGLL